MTATGARRPSDATSTERLLDRLTAVVSPHVKVPPSGLDPAVPLAEYGLDSVTAIALAAFGAIGFATVPPLQARVMQQAAGA
ncbi:acyl carrier protein, partial [Actinosynnema sp. NPDC059797]